MSKYKELTNRERLLVTLLGELEEIIESSESTPRQTRLATELRFCFKLELGVFDNNA